MNIVIATALAMALLSQCPTCPKLRTAMFAANSAVAETNEVATQPAQEEARLPYEFIISRSSDDLVPALSGATFAIATLDNDKLDIELIFRVGHRLSYTKLTDDPSLDFRPVWLPNGDGILFDSNRNRKIGIWKLTLSEKEPTPFISTEDGMCFAPAFSPDGNELAYTRTNFSDVAWWTNYVVPTVLDVRPESFQVIVRKLEGAVERILTYGMMPAWSPDGSRIAYSLFNGESWDLWIADAKSGNRTQLTRSNGSDVCASWSPDGKWIAYSRMNHETRTSDIWAVRADGQSPMQITDTPERNEGGPCWSLDGIYIHVDAGEGTPYDIALISKELLPSLATVSEGRVLASPQRQPTIQILNSTKITGLAAKAAEMLKKNGYAVADVGNSQKERNLKIGRIYYKAGFDAAASAIAGIIPCEFEIKEARSFQYDIVIVLGKNAKL